MEITDDMIKKKRKEFIDDIAAAINQKKGTQFSPAIQRLRQLARRPQRPYGS